MDRETLKCGFLFFPGSQKLAFFNGSGRRSLAPWAADGHSIFQPLQDLPPGMGEFSGSPAAPALEPFTAFFLKGCCCCISLHILVNHGGNLWGSVPREPQSRVVFSCVIRDRWVIKIPAPPSSGLLPGKPDDLITSVWNPGEPHPGSAGALGRGLCLSPGFLELKTKELTELFLGVAQLVQLAL